MFVFHAGEQEEVAAAARVKEVAYQLEQRVRQELAHPPVVHFYTWLLQGEQSCVASLQFSLPPSAYLPYVACLCYLHTCVIEEPCTAEAHACQSLCTELTSMEPLSRLQGMRTILTS